MLEKLKYFEYFLLRSLEMSKSQSNDFSILKTQKLLFFMVAAQKAEVNEIVLGESVFDNFKAYQYGPVEHSIYTSLKSRNNILANVTITSKGLEFLPELHISSQQYKVNSNLDKEVIGAIDASLFTLNSINPKLINYSAFKLVELSHRWKCWSNKYLNGDSDISYVDIKNDNQYYFT